MKRISKLLAVLLTLAMLFALAACGGDSGGTPPSDGGTAGSGSTGGDAGGDAADYDWPSMNIQIGHTNSSIETDYKQKLGNLFGEYVKEKTNGAITITVLGDSQLGKENALTEGLQLGMIDMAGLKFRTPETEIVLSIFKALGANPTAQRGSVPCGI